MQLRDFFSGNITNTIKNNKFIFFYIFNDTYIQKRKCLTKISHDVAYCLFQVVLVFILSIASLIIYFIDASR